MPKPVIIDFHLLIGLSSGLSIQFRSIFKFSLFDTVDVMVFLQRRETVLNPISSTPSQHLRQAEELIFSKTPPMQ